MKTAHSCKGSPSGNFAGSKFYLRVGQSPKWPRLITPLFLFLLTVLGWAESPQASFDNANKLYEQGNFAEAAGGFERLAKTGFVSEAIYFNWGNALFKAGQLGKAIAAYDTAQRLSPRDPDLLANLQFARNRVQAPTLPPDRASRWLERLSLNEWTTLAAAALWLCLAILTLGQLRPALRPVLKTWLLWSVLAMVLLCGGFAAALYQEHGVEKAVVVAPEATARRAPFEDSEQAFTLHDGAELHILDRKDQWLQVEASGRDIGWVPRDSVIFLRPD